MVGDNFFSSLTSKAKTERSKGFYGIAGEVRSAGGGGGVNMTLAGDMPRLRHLQGELATSTEHPGLRRQEGELAAKRLAQYGVDQNVSNRFH